MKGYMKEHDNLMFLKVKNSGHMVPMDLPFVSLQMMRTFVYSGSFRTFGQELNSTLPINNDCDRKSDIDNVTNDKSEDDIECEQVDCPVCVHPSSHPTQASLADQLGSPDTVPSDPSTDGLPDDDFLEDSIDDDTYNHNQKDKSSSNDENEKEEEESNNDDFLPNNDNYYQEPNEKEGEEPTTTTTVATKASSNTASSTNTANQEECGPPKNNNLLTGLLLGTAFGFFLSTAMGKIWRRRSSNNRDERVSYNKLGHTVATEDADRNSEYRDGREGYADDPEAILFGGRGGGGGDGSGLSLT